MLLKVLSQLTANGVAFQSGQFAVDPAEEDSKLAKGESSFWQEMAVNLARASEDKHDFATDKDVLVS